ncbi:type II toxin-antitoxin system VapC family toxin [Caulobacter mirabilis]|uniref:VapC toxin family PIN domain ribonuclease n=1 Tax=Caulobacter mirabilis TaxID=69666 RepID=A0A2D2AUT7_9CAUL|nr:type II toxin-antitoxin system VapC family toxin [Caulobacter mirabilis]ATQ41735.1 VapC toxin family PIN domain ribonuclease [Caulobacter mirabilis]
MIVVDSSAVIAILFGETIGSALADRLEKELHGQRVISAANYVEVGAVMAGRVEDPNEARSDLDQFLAVAGVEIAPLTAAQARLALEARVKFGRGFGSPAKLNFGDSFAYALAKSLNAPLLFVGDDFAATDITPAL